MTPTVLLLSDRAMIDHDPGPGHPERPQRLAAILDRLEQRTDLPVRWGRAAPAERGAIERLHRPEYIDGLGTGSAVIEPDTVLCPATIPLAYLSAGHAIEAVRAVCAGETQRAFSLGRPPGHHAEAARAMGFCLFNNIAIAAEHARVVLGCQRVAIIDWDVHHGNGTQHLFEERSDILVVNMHQHPLYPGTGAFDEIGRGPGEGFTVNVPLPSDFGDAEYLAVFDAIALPVVEAFAPDLVLVSAGFDAHERDPLGGMRVTTEGFRAMCTSIRELTDGIAGGHLALILEGGYDLRALAESVEACVEVLAGVTTTPTSAPARHGAAVVIDTVRRIHGRFWPLAATS
jgi:acetoin utilization deacetylase AcuC-like enzyme